MKTVTIYDSYRELPKAWDTIVQHDVFLQSKYLNALEEACPDNIQLFYIGVFDVDELVGVCIIQRVQLYLKDIFRNDNVSCLKEFFQSIVSKVLKGNILVVGNLTHTGQHSLFYKKERITQSDFLSLVFDALNQLKVSIKNKQNKKIRAIMFKDYFKDDPIHRAKDTFEPHRLYKITVQPNMIMPVKSNWLKFEDYKSSLNKKYRDRYKRARKKLGEVKTRELDLEAIRENTKALHGLYLNVSNNAKFNTFLLPENHFFSLKQQFGDSFKVFGYYLKEELIGFYTLILNNSSLETYFLGYNTIYQYPNQLYLNMLYDMAKFAIENQLREVVYARTAMAIKSSVGAETTPMLIYLKHTNKYFNALLKPIFGLMNPVQQWEARHPFIND